jgi:hypothetical protein
MATPPPRAAPAPPVKSPVAPPVYRPQPAPKVLQTKAALPRPAAPQTNSTAAAIPPNRARPTTTVAQPKMTAGRLRAGQPAHPPPQPPARPPRNVLQSPARPGDRVIQAMLQTPVATPSNEIENKSGYDAIEKKEVEEQQQSLPKQKGQWTHDEPRDPTQYEWKYLNTELGIVKEQQEEIELKVIGNNVNYDCFNWSLGYRQVVEISPPATHLGVDAIYERYGFTKTGDSSEAKVLVLFDANKFAVHAVAKITIPSLNEGSPVWSSKLGGSGLLITHKKALSIKGVYGATHWQMYK